jgi:hypothetical protein
MRCAASMCGRPCSPAPTRRSRKGPGHLFTHACCTDHIAGCPLPAACRLPRLFAEVGGLLSYGNDRRDQYPRAAIYADRILKGAKPRELPVQAPVKFELVINLKAAKALGLTVPDQLLALADEIIE